MWSQASTKPGFWFKLAAAAAAAADTHTVNFLQRWCVACFFGIKCLSNKRVFSMVIPCLHWIRISLHHPLWITVMWVTHTLTQTHSALTFLLYFREHSSAGTLIVVVWSSAEELARVLSVHSSPGKSPLHYINHIFLGFILGLW